MLEWYSNSKVTIRFSDKPCIGVRIPLPSDDTETAKSKEKYPFICKKSLDVEILDKKTGKLYKFTIPKGYCYDGASIPRLFWRVVGSNEKNAYLIAALVHDVLCENHHYVDNNRALSTNVFNALLEASHVNRCTRFLMKNSVACFQTLACKWSKK